MDKKSDSKLFLTLNEVPMKKIMIVALSILTQSALTALPVGNPSAASALCDGLLWEGHCGNPCDPCMSWCNAISFRLGFYGDYVFNRHLEIDRNEDNSDLDQTEIYTNAGMLVVNFWDRVDLFGVVGASNLSLQSNASAFTGTIGDIFELETDTNFSWSAGARATIWECGCTSLGVEAQYFYMNPDVKRISQAATDSIYPNSLIDAKYREWQLGVGVSHRINFFIPYIALKWSHSQLKFDQAQPGEPLPTDLTLFNCESKKDWGYAIGLSLVDCEKAMVTVEGRFGDEKALYVSGELRF